MKLNRLALYIVASIAILLVFLAADFQFDRRMEIETDFIKSQAYIGMLYPPENVNGSLIAKTPVNFKVSPPHYYDRVKISLEADNPSQAQLGVGIMVGKQGMITPIADEEIILELPRSNELKFVIASRPEDLEEPVVIKNIKLSFERDNLNLKGYIEIWAKGIQKIF